MRITWTLLWGPFYQNWTTFREEQRTARAEFSQTLRSFVAPQECVWNVTDRRMMIYVMLFLLRCDHGRQTRIAQD